MTLASMLDSYLARKALDGRAQAAISAAPLRYLDTSRGAVRVFDTGADQPCVIFVPDGPNVIEHYDRLIPLLADDFRVVCFDMPGFGFSMPDGAYRHSLDQGARMVLEVMDSLGIATATLAFSCANGLYALRACRIAPARIDSLFLAQTPSLHGMHAWARRMIPWPLRVPVLGQLLAWTLRKKMARGWYHTALPKNTDKAPYRKLADDALTSGSCFCLAGVVQGLSRESAASLAGVQAPCTMLWGSLDKSHRQTAPESLLDCVPHAEIIRFDECGHFPDLEQPQRYAQLLRAHLGRLSPPATAAKD